MPGFEKTHKPDEGNETDEEIKAANDNDRVKMLRQMANRSRDHANRAKNEITKNDNHETASAWRRHAEALESLQALRNSQFHTPEHPFHNEYAKTLGLYRETRRALKTYGRWDKTFK